jgi:uncharacterized protein YjbI with pentapeptide repeats
MIYKRIAQKGGKKIVFKTRKEKKTCQFEWGDHKCIRPSDIGEYCIFHSKDIEGKKDKFIDAFLKEFERQKEHEEIYDFTGFVFPGDIIIREKTFEKDVYFKVAQFSERADFMGSQFLGTAYFSGSQFSGLAYFSDAEFSGETDFGETQFFGDTAFGYAQFSRGLNFRGAKFSDGINFWYAKFSGEVHFSDAHLSGNANFSEVKFYETAVFARTKFSGEAYFSEARFFGEAYFTRAQFSKKANFKGSQFFGRSDFCNAQFSGGADFGGAEFTRYANFKIKISKEYNSFTMYNAYFYEVKGLFDIIKENKKKFKYSNKTKFLPDNFRLILGEKTAARFPVITRQIRDDMYLLKFKEKNPALHFLWWLFADCGRSFLRWALWSILLAVFFAFIYHNVFYLQDRSLFEANHINEIWSGFSFIYYSVVTFTTLGFGDIVPKSGCLQFWVMAEVIFGYVMLGGLISILANMLARRS